MTDLSFIGELKTIPLEVCQIADYFCVSKRSAIELISHMSGVERVGRRYRIPISEMPPEYWLRVGLIAIPENSNREELCKIVQVAKPVNKVRASSGIVRPGGQ